MVVPANAGIGVEQSGCASKANNTSCKALKHAVPQQLVWTMHGSGVGTQGACSWEFESSSCFLVLFSTIEQGCKGVAVIQCYDPSAPGSCCTYLRLEVIS